MTKLEMNSIFAENLEKERYSLGLSQKQMAEALDLSLSAYKRIINQSTDKIDLYIAYKLYRLTGRTICDSLEIPDPDREMRQKLQGLSESQKSFVHSIIEFENLFAATHEEVEEYITVFVPTGNMEDGMIYDSANVQKIQIVSYRKKYGVQINCGIKVTSNHLHPVYNLGDILLIAKRPIRDGDTGVFVNRENGCAYIRKFHQTDPCELEPINGYGETFYVDSRNKKEMDKWIKFGAVIAKIR